VSATGYRRFYGANEATYVVDGEAIRGFARELRRASLEDKAKGKGAEARVARFALSQMGTGPVTPL
jgi:hypothetical protein